MEEEGADAGFMLLWISVQLVLILLNAIFACAEIAVLSANETKMEALSEEGNKRAKKVLSFFKNPEKFLATIQVAITLSGFMGSAFAAENFSDLLTNAISKTGIGISKETLDVLCVIIITILLSYVTLVLGELVPKRIAMKKTEKIALGMSGMLSVTAKLFTPVVWLLSVSTNGILHILGISGEDTANQVSEEDIRLMVKKGEQTGVINSSENQLIQNVFEFNDITVGEFLTHRKDVDVLWMEESPEDWDQIIRDGRHTMYPICNTSIDKVEGILDTRDYHSQKTFCREQILSSCVKPPYFVLETIRADLLFRQMKQNKKYFAIVLDEYGGFIGIVTMHDLLEQLVGELCEPTEAEPEPQIIDLGNCEWNIKGSVSLDIVSKTIGIPLPMEEYETLSGYILGKYGYIPEDGSQFEFELDSLNIKVLQMKDHCVETALIRLINVA